jgi:signal transduction histidine kinase
MSAALIMAAAGDPIRILLVEDSELDAELIVDHLLGDGLAVDARRIEDEASFASALEEFRPDVIISDLSMPQFSGYRALELARRTAPDIPFIFVSGTMGEEAAVEAVRSGATDYVLKHSMARLASSVRRALREAEDRKARSSAEQNLFRAQRYEGLALLASGLSHDLRNVLQPISMGAKMLLEENDEQVRKVGALVQDCAQRGLDIVTSMLTFARGARNTTEKVKVAALFEGLGYLLRGSVPRNVSLVIERPPSDLEIEGNYTELQQCLLNLSLNALQAMPDGGTLELGATLCELDHKFFMETESARPGAYLKISVKDTGIGMSEEIKSNLFKAFFTTKKEGTGLGLLSCRRILDNHLSYLRVDSEPGRGSTFSVYLPLLQSGAAVDSTAEMPLGTGQRVLIVMEEAGTLSLLSDTLRSHAYAVSAAKNGAAALQEIDAYGLPDLVLMEAEMSLMTGVRTLAALLEQDFKGPVIMMVRSGVNPIIDDLPPVERVRFIEKPVDTGTLLRVVAEELGGANASQSK